MEKYQLLLWIEWHWIENSQTYVIFVQSFKERKKMLTKMFDIISFHLWYKSVPISFFHFFSWAHYCFLLHSLILIFKKCQSNESKIEKRKKCVIWFYIHRRMNVCTVTILSDVLMEYKTTPDAILTWKSSWSKLYIENIFA